MIQFHNRFLAAAAIALLLPAGASAIPAKPGVLQYPLPDGTTVPVILTGDEHAHAYTTTDGFALRPDKSGRLMYVTLDTRGRAVMSDVVASAPESRSAAERAFTATIDREGVQRAVNESLTQARRNAPSRIPSSLITKYPVHGSPKSLVILAEFQDIKFATPDVHNAFNRLVKETGYDHNGATGSALDYFRDNSYGAFTPDFVVLGPVTLPQNEPYYGASTATQYDANGFLMARDAVMAVIEQYPDVDFSQFDNDGDGFVDSAFIFYAGFGQNEGAPDWTIWPHAAGLWSMYNIDLSANGVKFDKYACTNELQGTRGTTLTGIGTLVHEYSHILGLMDHYPTKMAGSARDVSAGNWDVMDNGSYNNHGNTPPHLNAFERYSLGWLNPRKLTGPENVVLNPLHESNEALLIQTEKDEEFFILENRQQQAWDAHIEGHGMLIWHIDYDADIWEQNNINNEYYHQRVDLVEADNIIGDLTRPGDAFPGTSAVREFTANSTPAMTTWINVDPDLPLTDIYEIDQKITFRVKGGGDALTAPVALDASDVTPTSFVARWELVPSIADYEVDVCLGRQAVPFKTVKVSGATSAEVSNLNPSTEYSYLVRSLSDGRTSANSNRVTVVTLPPSFDMLAPEALEATEVSHEAFTARWNDFAQAGEYLIDVYTKQAVAPQMETVDFSNGLTLPDGWYTNCTKTASVAGYFGQSAPSLRMIYDGDRIETDAYPGGLNTLSFWYRGNSTDSESSLTVESYVNGVWTPILEEKPLQKTEGGVTVSIDNGQSMPMPSGTTRLRIVFNRAQKGSLYLDDISVAHDASFNKEYCGDYHNASCGTNLSCRVEGLKKSTQYFFIVTAVSGDGVRSLPSNEIEVITKSGSDGMETIEAGSATFTIANGSVEITASTPTSYAVHTPAGITVASGTCRGTATVKLNARGVYIVTLGAKAYKVIL